MPLATISSFLIAAEESLTPILMHFGTRRCHGLICLFITGYRQCVMVHIDVWVSVANVMRQLDISSAIMSVSIHVAQLLLLLRQAIEAWIDAVGWCKGRWQCRNPSCLALHIHIIVNVLRIVRVPLRHSGIAIEFGCIDMIMRQLVFWEARQCVLLNETTERLLFRKASKCATVGGVAVKRCMRWYTCEALSMIMAPNRVVIH